MHELNEATIESVRRDVLAQVGPEKYNALVRCYSEVLERRKLRFWQQELFDSLIRRSSMPIDPLALFEQVFAGATLVVVPDKPFVYPRELHDALAFAVARSDSAKIRDCFRADPKLPEFLASQRLPTWIMCEAGKHASPETVRLLVELGCDVNQSDSNEFTGLCWAASSSRYEVAKTFLELGADPNQGQPLFTLFFANEDPVRMAKLLLQHGADPHLTKWIDNCPVDLVSRARWAGLKELADYFRGIGVRPLH